MRCTRPVFQRLHTIYGPVLCLLLSLSLFAQAPSTPSQTAAVPRLVQFSGVVKDADGTPRKGLVGITFALYKEEQGGAPLWLETQNVQLDVQGRYSVYLGATKSAGLPPELFASGEARWLGVRPENQDEQPRSLLLSVPYALKAGDAATLGGLPASAFLLAAGAAPIASPATGASTGNAGANVPPPAPCNLTSDSTAVKNQVAKFSAPCNVEPSAITETAGEVGINNSAPSATLDVKGSTKLRGKTTLPAVKTATASTGSNSQPLVAVSSAFNSGTAAAVNQNFELQAEPLNNNTATPSGTLNLLFAPGTGAYSETGLNIASNGQIHFAAGQTFPGTGTITGVTAGTDLTGGGNSGNVTLNLDTTKVPLLNAANTFTASQAVTGNLAASGTVSGGVVNAGSSFTLGGTPFAFGTSTFFSSNAYVGFAGSSGATGNDNFGAGNGALGFLTTGSDNTAVGVNALPANDVGASNTASGYQALFFNSSGNSNTAEGVSAMFSNQSGNGNTAVGVGALEGNTSGSSNTALGVQALADGGGSNNTAVGANAGPDASHLNLSNTTAIGANAQVTASNSLVLGSINGVNGATADTLVGIGTTAPTAKLDVHGNANFTGPITFAAGQVFPGTGTITGVTPGTGLSGGGTGGNVPVSLNTSFTDGRYAQLTANNAFSGSQTVNNSVGIGTVPNPAFALQAIGTIRSETGGLSIGGNAPVQVDAPGIAGGRLTILSNGDVGINKPSPTATLDVAGVVNATALAIHGDTPMNAAPHMYFSGFFAGSIATGQEGAFIVPSKSILITRMTMMSGFSQIICSPPGTISIQKDNSPVTYLYSLSFGGPAASDSGPISVPVAGGTPIELIVSVGPVCGIYQGPNNVNVNVEYVMQ